MDKQYDASAALHIYVAVGKITHDPTVKLLVDQLAEAISVKCPKEECGDEGYSQLVMFTAIEEIKSMLALSVYARG